MPSFVALSAVLMANHEKVVLTLSLKRILDYRECNCHNSVIFQIVIICGLCSTEYEQDLLPNRINALSFVLFANSKLKRRKVMNLVPKLYRV